MVLVSSVLSGLHQRLLSKHSSFQGFSASLFPSLLPAVSGSRRAPDYQYHSAISPRSVRGEASCPPALAGLQWGGLRCRACASAPLPALDLGPSAPAEPRFVFSALRARTVVPSHWLSLADRPEILLSVLFSRQLEKLTWSAAGHASAQRGGLSLEPSREGGEKLQVYLSCPRTYRPTAALPPFLFPCGHLVSVWGL